MFTLLDRIAEGLTTEGDAFEIVMRAIVLMLLCFACGIVAAVVIGGY